MNQEEFNQTRKSVDDVVKALAALFMLLFLTTVFSLIAYLIWWLMK